MTEVQKEKPDNAGEISKKKNLRTVLIVAGVLAIIAIAGYFTFIYETTPKPITLQTQGSFAVGGTIVTAPGTFDPIRQGAYNPAGPDSAGQTLHGDHAFIFYQIPEHTKNLPLVFWHGYGQSMKTWQTTPDGRDGFQTIFLKRDYSVYLLDQPRRGEAGRSTVNMTIPVAPDEQLWFGIFRFGVWPNFYDGVQFSRDPEALNQFFRQGVPSPASFDNDVNTAAVSALFDKTGPGILVTHSASGGPGWQTAIRNQNVKAIVSFEPGAAFPFPEGEAPEPIAFNNGNKAPLPTVPMADFEKLTKIPIVIYYGDNIPAEPSTNPGQDQWRVFYGTAKMWRDVVNRHGGDVTIVHLPEEGIYGNTHFPMSDLNNIEIADHMSDFLARKGLDRY
jgi:pimeloyl-ACP methyl ester carboxylesterase